jgi:hypothetical protein
VIGIERHMAAPAAEAAGAGDGGAIPALYRRAAERWGRLAAYGGLTVACYALFALLARLISFGRVEPGILLYLAVMGAGAIFVAMIALLARTLWVALRGTADLADPAARRTILLTALAAGLCLITVPRLFSKDVLSYLVYGQAFGVYGLNPYTTSPNHMQFDFNFRLIDWHDSVSVYGPVWTLLCTALYKVTAPLATSHIWGYIVGFRALGLAFHLGNAALIWSILGRLRPRQRIAGTLFYAWNPLALIEFAGNGHNDAGLVFFLLAAIAAHLAPRRRPWLVALFLTLSILTKFITLLVVPAYLLLLWRTTPAAPGRWFSRARVAAWAQAGAVAVATFAIFWAPFASALRNPTFLLDATAMSRYDNSLLQLVFWVVRSLLDLVLPSDLSTQLAGQGVKLVGRAVFLILWVVMTWRTRNTDSWLRASFWILFGYLVLATPWFWPWYVTWLVALAPLVATRLATAVTLTFSVSVLVIYVMWGNILPFDRGSVYPIHNIVAFGLPLLMLWLQLRRHGPSDQPVYCARGEQRRALPEGAAS